MALFVVIGHDCADGTALRDKNREAHVAFIEALDKAGKIQFAGPIKSDDGAVSTGVVILLEAASLEEAKKITNEDPYVTGGVYSVLTVCPIRKVFPKRA
jgi:uncharacterized protein